MRGIRIRIVATLALAAASVAPQAAAGSTPPGQQMESSTYAVIGDTPYSTFQIQHFPDDIAEINADPDVSRVIHLGDIKSGSTRCDTIDSNPDTGDFTQIRSDFDLFQDPLVYTPGDNEWTDCHRANNGAYQPLDRLAFDRSIFFDNPGTTLGAPRKVTVPNPAYPENVTLRRADVDVAVLHVVGSNDDLQPWTGVGNSTATAAQVAEERDRMAANLALLRDTFAQARQRHDRAVLVMQQADMFDPTYTPTPADISAFTPLVQALVDETSAFDGEVYLFNGDSHIYNTDRPLAPRSVWLQRYGVTGSAAGLQRITVDGSSNNVDWLKVTVNRPGAEHVLSWERVPYAG
jgi:hypothetical protein